MRNRRTYDDLQYTVPSPSSYPYQWLWDSCFHAITLSHFDHVSAAKELLSATERQFNNGMLPHITYWHPHDQLQFDWGVEGTSAITQPPIIAYATLCVYQASKNKDFLQKIYPRLKQYFAYLETRRDDTGLYGVINPDETGEDNSPRFDSSLKLNPKHTVAENNKKRFSLFADNKACDYDAQVCIREHFWVLDVAFNSYLVEGFESMKHIAQHLQHHEDGDMYEKKAGDLRTCMKNKMIFNNAAWSLDTNKQPIETLTWAVFTPLLADVYSKEQAENVIQIYLKNSNHFATPFVLPTTAVSEQGFNPIESTTEAVELHPNWRGPIWMAANWLTYRGLKKYGFDHEANTLAATSRKLIKKSGFREYYDPFTGKGMGAHDFTWGGLVLDMQS